MSNASLLSDFIEARDVAGDWDLYVSKDRLRVSRALLVREASVSRSSLYKDSQVVSILWHLEERLRKKGILVCSDNDLTLDDVQQLSTLDSLNKRLTNFKEGITQLDCTIELVAQHLKLYQMK